MTNTARKTSILTDADKTAIEAETRRFGFTTTDDVERAIDRTAFEVKRFVEGWGVFSTPLVKWQERVAATLTGVFRFPHVQYHTVSATELRAEFERQAAEYEAEWDDEGGEYPFRPWDGIETARAFLNATPYTVYRLAEKVLRIGRDIVEDSALDIVSGSHTGIAEAMEGVYNEEITKLLKASGEY